MRHGARRGLEVLQEWKYVGGLRRGAWKDQRAHPREGVAGHESFIHQHEAGATEGEGGSGRVRRGGGSDCERSSALPRRGAGASHAVSITRMDTEGAFMEAVRGAQAKP